MTALEITDAPHKLILLGQAPSRHTDPGVAIIAGRAGSTLAKLAGLSVFDLLRAVKPINILPDWEGPADDLPMSLAADAAECLLPRLRGRRVVMLGRAVGRVFGVGRDKDFLWHGYTRGFDGLLFPHPGGVPRWWSDPENTRRAETALRCELAAIRNVSRGTAPNLGH